MPSFSYRGMDAGGRKVSGMIEAADRKQALRKLRAGNIRPLDVQADSGKARAPAPKTRGRTPSPLPDSSEGAARKSALFSRRVKPSRRQSLPFFRKLHQLHKSGMPVGDAVQIMGTRMGDPGLKALAGEVYRDLSEGRTLAASMRGHPEYFEPTMAYLLEAGEATGNVLPILVNIIEHMERRDALRKEVQSAMAYPVLICTVALGVVALFLFYLLPRIQSMLGQMGGELNLSARILIGTANFALVQGPFILAALAVVGFALAQWRKTEAAGRLATDGFALRVPILSGLYYNADICRMANILSVLLANGVNTTESLRLAENTLNNRLLKAKYEASRVMINDGAPFSAAFRRYALLPDMDLDILSIGENTGDLAPGFREVYQTHAAELSARLGLLTKLIAGVALGFAFTLVFVLTLAIVMSILNMSQSVLSM